MIEKIQGGIIVMIFLLFEIIVISVLLGILIIKDRKDNGIY